MAFIFLVTALFCLAPFVSGAMALVAGMLYALALGNPWLDYTQRYTSKLLQVSVVGLGAGMNLYVVGEAGASGFAYTAIGIGLTLFVGVLLGRLFKCEERTSMLVCVGTAICGGSAIAAVAPTIKAKAGEVSVALATVFFLNAIALVIFPMLGQTFNLSQDAFGLWSALAIHDTSSVVGSALQYGERATEVATTVKLARALWIVPVTFAIGFFWRQEHDGATPKLTVPWFILGFVLTAALFTFVPNLSFAGEIISFAAKRTLVLTLFLVGAGLSKETLLRVGARPLLLGVSLWVFVASATLIALQNAWIV